MGRLIDVLNKNIFITPDSGNGTLEVYIGEIVKKNSKEFEKMLGRGLFEGEANKKRITDINIVTGKLSQKDFNRIIDVIKESTDKPTCITFVPEKEEKEYIRDAYKRYVKTYKEQDPENPKHFPDNILITNTLVESDEIKENYKKKRY